MAAERAMANNINGEEKETVNGEGKGQVRGKGKVKAKGQGKVKGKARLALKPRERARCPRADWSSPSPTTGTFLLPSISFRYC